MARPCRCPNWRDRLSKAAKCTHDESWERQVNASENSGCQNSGKMVDSRPSPRHISSQISLVENIASKFYKYSTIRSTVVKISNLLFPVEQWRSIWVTLCDVVTSTTVTMAMWRCDDEQRSLHWSWYKSSTCPQLTAFQKCFVSFKKAIGTTQMCLSGKELCLVFSLRVPPLSNSIPQITCDKIRGQSKAGVLQFYIAPFKAGKGWPQGAEKERWKQSIVAISWLLFRFNCKTVRTGHERLFTAPEAWTQDDERVGEGFTHCRHLNLASL